MVLKTKRHSQDILKALQLVDEWAAVPYGDVRVSFISVFNLFAHKVHVLNSVCTIEFIHLSWIDLTVEGQTGIFLQRWSIPPVDASLIMLPLVSTACISTSPRGTRCPCGYRLETRDHIFNRCRLYQRDVMEHPQGLLDDLILFLKRNPDAFLLKPEPEPPPSQR